MCKASSTLALPIGSSVEERSAHSGVTRAEPFKQKPEGSIRRRVPEDPALLSLPGTRLGRGLAERKKIACIHQECAPGVIRPRTYSAQIRSTLTWRGQAPSEDRTCPLRQKRRRAFVSTARSACLAPASVTVTAITDLLLGYPSFFGRRETQCPHSCAERTSAFSRLSWNMLAIVMFLFWRRRDRSGAGRCSIF